MPIERKTVSVPLTAGLNQKADLRTLAINGAATMTNCVMQKTGAVRKRFGHTALSKSTTLAGTIAAAVAGGSYRGIPWMSDGETLYEWSDLAAAWTPIDTVPDAVALDRVGITSMPVNPLDYDQAYGQGYLVVVWTADPAGLGFTVPFYKVLDPATQAVLLPDTPVDPAIASQVNAPKLTVCGQTLLLTYVRAGNICGRVATLAAAYASGWSGEVVLANDGVGNVTSGVYDVAPVANDASRFCIAYEVSHAGKSVAISTFNTGTLTLAHTEYDDTAFSSLTAIAVVATNTELMWATYFGVSGGISSIRAWAWQDGTPASHVAPFTVTGSGTSTPGRVVAIRNDAQHITVYWSQFLNTAADDGTNLVAAVTRAVTLISTSTFARIRPTGPCVIASKPVLAPNGGCYLALALPSVAQGTFFLARDYGFGDLGFAQHPMTPVATLDPRLSKYTALLIPTGNQAQTAPHAVILTTVGAGVVGVMAFENTSPTHVAFYEHAVDTASPLRYFGGELYELEALSAGTPLAFDGQNIVENGFFAYPQLPAPSFSGVGGSMQTSGLYQYIATYEWYDARGQIHRSATSPAVQVTATGAGNTGSCTVTVPGVMTRLAPSTSTSPAATFPSVILYRTQANGAVFYRVTADPAPLANDAASAFVTITDTASDASIATNPLLYTTGGVLDNFCPPSGRILITHRNRWWVAGCPDPTALWPSKEITPAELPGFNEAMNFTCTGAIRALASMDDKLVVGVQRGSLYGIEVITGEGPTDAGTQSDWTPPQSVPSDAGPVDQRGICSGPFGTLFRSLSGGPTGAGGIFLLSRDLQVSYLSGPVEDALAANPVVTSMVVHPTAGRVYITCVPSDPGFASGVRLVWDYQQGGVWSLDTLYDVDTATVPGARCAWVAQAAGRSVVHWATTAGRVYRETNGLGANAYTDAGHWISMTYASAWLKPTEGGFARFWRVLCEGDSLDPASLTVTLTFDGAPSSYYSESSAWAYAGAISAFDRFPQVDVQMTPGNQKAKSIQVTMSDAPPSPPSFTTGQGFSFGAIVLDLGVKDGTYRNVPPAQRA